MHNHLLMSIDHCIASQKPVQLERQPQGRCGLGNAPGTLALVESLPSHAAVLELCPCCLLLHFQTSK